MLRVAAIAATLALTLTACSGGADDYVSPLTDADLAALNEQVNDLPTRDKLAAIGDGETQDSAAEDSAVEGSAAEGGADGSAAEGGADGSAAEGSADDDTIPTLPGQGATLSPDAKELGHWNYFPAKAWTPTEEADDSSDTYTTETGTAEVRVLGPSALSAEGQVGLITDQVYASHGDVEVYDSGTYEHTNGYQVVWIRFDAIDDTTWTPGQRFWILAEDSTLQVELMGDDAESFDDELFALQGVVNEVDCPEKP